MTANEAMAYIVLPATWGVIVGLILTMWTDEYF
jgi:hypothetical protein